MALTDGSSAFIVERLDWNGDPDLWLFDGCDPLRPVWTATRFEAVQMDTKESAEQVAEIVRRSTRFTVRVVSS